MNVRQAVGVIIISDNKLALVHKVANSDGSPVIPYWGLPMGGIEGDESNQEAAIREAAEETGLELDNNIIFIGTFEYEFPEEVRNISGYDRQNVTVYRIDMDKELEMTPDGEEIDDCKWCTIEECLKIVNPDTKRFLEEHFRMKK